MVDMAPTILHILGVPVPRAMDGRVLTGIFDNSDDRVVEYQDVSLVEEQALHTFSQEEQRIIEQRLHDLGYI